MIGGGYPKMYFSRKPECIQNLISTTQSSSLAATRTRRFGMVDNINQTEEMFGLKSSYQEH